MVKMGGKVEERWRKVHGGGGDNMWRIKLRLVEVKMLKKS